MSKKKITIEIDTELLKKQYHYLLSLERTEENEGLLNMIEVILEKDGN